MFVETIRRNGENLTQLIDDVLDSAAKSKLTKRLFGGPTGSPWKVVDDVVATLRIRAAEKNLLLETDCQFPIPEIIQTDPLRLRQILINLIGNAIKFTERGSVTVRLRYMTDLAMGSRMQFAITDTGIGISSEDTSRIFEPLTQADGSVSRCFGGTGLGLTISRRLAKMLGGDISVISQLGQGSTFTLTIDGGSPNDHMMLEALPTPVIDHDHGKPTEKSPISSLQGSVLVVEDIPESRQLVRTILDGGWPEQKLIALRTVELPVLKSRHLRLLINRIPNPEWIFDARDERIRVGTTTSSPRVGSADRGSNGPCDVRRP